MAREPRTTDFVAQVDGVGIFTFAKRDMRDNFKVRAEYVRLTEGVTPTGDDDFMDIFAGAVAAIKVLTVEAPAGWEIDALDPFDDENYGKVMKVWEALRGKELTFRPNRAGVQNPGQGAGGVIRDMVSADL